MLLDCGEEESEDDPDELECASGVSRKESSEVSHGEDLKPGGSGWLGTQMYHAKDALFRTTLNNRLIYQTSKSKHLKAHLVPRVRHVF